MCFPVCIRCVRFEVGQLDVNSWHVGASGGELNELKLPFTNVDASQSCGHHFMHTDGHWPVLLHIGYPPGVTKTVSPRLVAHGVVMLMRSW